MSVVCGSRHPEHPEATCIERAKHAEHTGFFEGQAIDWPNEDFEPPRAAALPKDARAKAMDAITAVVNRPAPGRFGGNTYVPEFDRERLGRQLGVVYDLMADGQWRTLAEIGAVVEEPEASVSARLRDLRKPDFGAFTVERRRRGRPADGIHEYRLGPPQEI